MHFDSRGNGEHFLGTHGLYTSILLDDTSSFDFRGLKGHSHRVRTRTAPYVSVRTQTKIKHMAHYATSVAYTPRTFGGNWAVMEGNNGKVSKGVPVVPKRPARCVADWLSELSPNRKRNWSARNKRKHTIYGMFEIQNKLPSMLSIRKSWSNYSYYYSVIYHHQVIISASCYCTYFKVLLIARCGSGCHCHCFLLSRKLYSTCTTCMPIIRNLLNVISG